MPSEPVTRIGDFCSGHGCWPPRPTCSASPNVLANSLHVHRKDDEWITHCCGPSCHSSQLESGSSTVFANSLDVCRIGDPVKCGSRSAQGSPNVFAGG